MNTIPEFHRFISKKKLIPESFNDELTDAVKLITHNEKNITFAGSYIRKSLSYSADIDISEEFDSTAKDIAHALQSIVKKILKSDNYILDIKSGYDTTFEPYFHSLGELKEQKIINYDPNQTQIDINDCQGYMSKSQFNELTRLNSLKSVSAWLELRETIRKLITLRWTTHEIIVGYKQGVKNRILLSDAVNTFVTKIDMAFIYQGFYTEMSNIFITPNSSKHGLVFFPVSSQPKYFSDAIKYNLFEYLNDKEKHYLKALKRVFTLALVDNDKQIQKKIAPILISNISLLNKVTSILSTHLDMLEKLSYPPIVEIKHEMSNLKPVLANIYEFPFNEPLVDASIDKICRSKSMMKPISLLIDHLKKIINTETVKYIQLHKISIPSKYLP